MTKTYTPEDILRLKPCADYTPERVRDLFGRRKSATLANMMRCRRVPVQDRLWLASRLLSVDQRQAWTTRIVTRAIKQHAINCGIPEVERWARAWLDGSDRSAEAARSAAAAAWNAEAATWNAAAAARSAVAATWNAAAAAWSAEAARSAAAAAWSAEAATWNAGEAAAARRADAARRAERRRQVRDVLAVLREER